MIKAAILTNFKKKLKFVRIKIPKLLEGQVLVKNKFTSICGSQIFEINGGRNNKRFLPHMLGHESSGVVVSMGKGIKKVKIKDKVYLSWILSSGKDAEEPKFEKGINSGKITTFSNYSIVPENRVNLIPKNVDYKTASLLGCALPTGAGIVINQMCIKKNLNICVVGMGGVGISALLALIFFGVKKRYITAIDNNTSRINYLRKFKEFMGINFQSKIYKKNIIKNCFFDYIIECSGKTSQIELALDMIKNSGKVIFASHPNKNEKLKINPFDLIKGKKIEGSWGGLVNFDRDIDFLVEIIKKYKNINKIFFNKIYDFNKINKAIEDMQLGKVIRPLIKF